MFEYINGKLVVIGDDYAVIDINGMGFKVHTRTASVNKHNKGDIVKLFTYLHVRENEISLYGFTSTQELDLYEKLINVSGIGPKVAINILNHTNIKDFISAIAFDDIKALCKLPGIGKKTAQKILLELKDKLSLSDVSSDYEDFSTPNIGDDASEAVLALQSLGYDSLEASKAVSKIATDEDTVEGIIKKALKELARF
jgi:Holliday junction DNA helicase RuvA